MDPMGKEKKKTFRPNTKSMQINVPQADKNKKNWAQVATTIPTKKNN